MSDAATTDTTDTTDDTDSTDSTDTGSSGSARRAPVIVRVPIGRMTVDPELQREWKRSRSEAIARDFDEAALGLFTLSDRDDGGPLRIVDGQHRWRSMGILEFDPTYEVVAKVCYDLDRRQEARLFRLLNNTAKPNPLTLFDIAVVEGEPVSTQIHDVLTRAGWKVGTGPQGTNRFQAVGAAKWVYREAERRNNREPGWGKSALERVIMILTRAYRHNTPGSVDALLVKSLGFLIITNWDKLNDGLMVEKFEVHPGAARGVLARAEGMTAGGTTKTQALVDYLISLYNEGLPVKRRLARLPAKGR